jgi:hypothetical protein
VSFYLLLVLTVSVEVMSSMLFSLLHRYICFIMAPAVTPRCSASNQGSCPPYHIESKSRAKIYSNDTARFPYQCYYMHCFAPNDNSPDAFGHWCDPYSNPAPQELLQLLPCPQFSTCILLCARSFRPRTTLERRRVTYKVVNLKWSTSRGYLQGLLTCYQ